MVTHCSTQGDREQGQGGRLQEMQFDDRKSSGEFKDVAKMLSKVATKMQAAKEKLPVCITAGEPHSLPLPHPALEGEYSPAEASISRNKNQFEEEEPEWTLSMLAVTQPLLMSLSVTHFTLTALVTMTKATEGRVNFRSKFIMAGELVLDIEVAGHSVSTVSCRVEWRFSDDILFFF